MTALLAVLAVLLLLGLVPVGVTLRYDSGAMEVKLKLGPFRIPIYPVGQPHGKKLARQYGRKVKAEREKRKKKAEKKARKKKPRERKEKKLSFDELMQLLGLAWKAVGGLPRKLVVKELYLHVTYREDDAARAAIGYGRAWAVAGTALPVLERVFRIRKQDVGVDLDYEREPMEVFARLDIHILIGTAALLAFRTGFGALKLLLSSKIKGSVKE